MARTHDWRNGPPISTRRSRDPAFAVFFDAAATHATRCRAQPRRSPPASTSIARSRWRQRWPRRMALLQQAQARGLKPRRGRGQDLSSGPAEARALVRGGDARPHRRVSGSNSAGGCSTEVERPAQRPSWNYRSRGGGGLILDMYPHWRYVIEGHRRPHRAGRLGVLDGDAGARRRTRTALRRRRRGQRRHAGRARRRRLRHCPLLLGYAGAARGPAHLAGRRQQSLGARRPASLPCADYRRDACDSAFQRDAGPRRRLSQRLDRGAGPARVSQSLSRRLGAISPPCRCRRAAGVELSPPASAMSRLPKPAAAA